MFRYCFLPSPLELQRELLFLVDLNFFENQHTTLPYIFPLLIIHTLSLQGTNTNVYASDMIKAQTPWFIMIDKKLTTNSHIIQQNICHLQLFKRRSSIPSHLEFLNFMFLSKIHASNFSPFFHWGVRFCFLRVIYT